MTDQQDRWDQIRDAVARRMRHLRIPDQATLRRLSGLSQPTAQLYTTKGVGGVPRRQQAHMLAQALQWPDDWYERIAAGEDLEHWATQPVDARDAHTQIAEILGLMNDRFDRVEARLAENGARLDESDRLLEHLAQVVDRLDAPTVRPEPPHGRKPAKPSQSG